MGNKLWIAALGFSAFTLAALALVTSVWMGFDHVPLRTIILPTIGVLLMSAQAARLAILRIKYGPAGPPKPIRIPKRLRKARTNN
ncbi:MAG: hypothetical protein V4555_15390 [Acidobacteriota bacterium]